MNDREKFAELQKIIENHEKRILELETLFKSKSVSIPTSGEEVVLKLLNSGFFNTQKKYGEMIKELKIQAKFKKTHKYKKILAKLTQEDKLERKSSHKQWVYSKK